MLEDYFSYRGVLKRLRSGALGAEMDRIAERFSLLGYKRASAKIYLSRIAQQAQNRSAPMMAPCMVAPRGTVCASQTACLD